MKHPDSLRDMWLPPKQIFPPSPVRSIEKADPQLIHWSTTGPLPHIHPPAMENVPKYHIRRLLQTRIRLATAFARMQRCKDGSAIDTLIHNRSLASYSSSQCGKVPKYQIRRLLLIQTAPDTWYNAGSTSRHSLLGCEERITGKTNFQPRLLKCRSVLAINGAGGAAKSSELDAKK